MKLSLLLLSIAHACQKKPELATTAATTTTTTTTTRQLARDIVDEVPIELGDAEMSGDEQIFE